MEPRKTYHISIGLLGDSFRTGWNIEDATLTEAKRAATKYVKDSEYGEAWYMLITSKGENDTYSHAEAWKYSAKAVWRHM